MGSILHSKDEIDTYFDNSGLADRSLSIDLGREHADRMLIVTMTASRHGVGATDFPSSVDIIGTGVSLTELSRRSVDNGSDVGLNFIIFYANESDLSGITGPHSISTSGVLTDFVDAAHAGSDDDNHGGWVAAGQLFYGIDQNTPIETHDIYSTSAGSSLTTTYSWDVGECYLMTGATSSIYDDNGVMVITGSGMNPNPSSSDSSWSATAIAKGGQSYAPTLLAGSFMAVDTFLWSTSYGYNFTLPSVDAAIVYFLTMKQSKFYADYEGLEVGGYTKFFEVLNFNGVDVKTIGSINGARMNFYVPGDYFGSLGLPRPRFDFEGLEDVTDIEFFNYTSSESLLNGANPVTPQTALNFQGWKITQAQSPTSDTGPDDPFDGDYAYMESSGSGATVGYVCGLILPGAYLEGSNVSLKYNNRNRGNGGPHAVLQVRLASDAESDPDTTLWETLTEFATTESSTDSWDSYNEDITHSLATDTDFLQIRLLIIAQSGTTYLNDFYVDQVVISKPV